MMNAANGATRIQERNRRSILDAALKVFSARGYGGATLNEIAQEAGLSKPNLLYYFEGKEAVYRELLKGLLDEWLAPLDALNPDGDPVEELMGYVTRKLEMSRANPEESRLFANEILQGAPQILDIIEGPLRDLVDEKAAIVARWADAGKIAPLDPHHLIFSVWATTQHYADFDVQVRGILGERHDADLSDAQAFLLTLYRRALTPD